MQYKPGVVEPRKSYYQILLFAIASIFKTGHMYNAIYGLTNTVKGRRPIEPGAPELMIKSLKTSPCKPVIN